MQDQKTHLVRNATDDTAICGAMLMHREKAREALEYDPDIDDCLGYCPCCVGIVHGERCEFAETAPVTVQACRAYATQLRECVDRLLYAISEESIGDVAQRAAVVDQMATMIGDYQKYLQRRATLDAEVCASKPAPAFVPEEDDVAC